MQISLLTTVPDSKEKLRNASAETADGVSTSAFFAQISRVWQSGEEPDGNACEEIPAEQGCAGGEAVTSLRAPGGVPVSGPDPQTVPVAGSAVSKQVAALMQPGPECVADSQEGPAVPCSSETPANSETAPATIEENPGVISALEGPSPSRATRGTEVSRVRLSELKELMDLNKSRASQKTHSDAVQTPKASSGGNSAEQAAPGVHGEAAVDESRFVNNFQPESRQTPQSATGEERPGAGDDYSGKGTQGVPAAGKSDGLTEVRALQATDLSAGQENASNRAAVFLQTHSRFEQSQLNAADGPSGEAPPETSAQLPSGSGPVRAADLGSPRILSKPEIAPHEPNEFILRLAERIAVQVRDGKGEIHIQLKPDNLGRLEIRAENSANGIVARIVAESSETRNYLETNLHLLQQTLQDQGLKIERVQVALQENFGSQSFAGFTAESGHAGSESPGQEASRPSNVPTVPGLEAAEQLIVDPVPWTPANPNVRFHAIA